ncbi:MAG: HAD family hydrolase [Myxococcota bacterium]
MERHPVRWSEVDTLFLDAGGTLITMDFARIARELAALGAPCSADALSRAEAAARPLVSRLIASGGSTEGRDTFSYFVERVLERILDLDGDACARLVDRLVPRIRVPGRSLELWSVVLPGVAPALARLRAAGVQLVVVSNADGTVEEGLTRVGLRPHLDAVIDSAVVGFEKPDPRIFASALAAGRCDPARTLHVGDVYAADVLGARAAGLRAVLLDPHGDWGEVDCEVARDVPEVAERILSARGR